MNPSLFSIYSTFVSFIVMIIYYYSKKPEFVMYNKKLSVRLVIIYSLLFSSCIGLFVLGTLVLLKNYHQDN